MSTFCLSCYATLFLSLVVSGLLFGSPLLPAFLFPFFVSGLLLGGPLLSPA